jgi:putative ABC transport system permease protein
MIALREWLARLWGTWRPGRRDADLEQELRLHIDLARDAVDEARRRAGSTGAEPRAVALHVGALAQSMEALRDQRGLPWLDDLRRDLRYGLRALRRNPVFAVVSLLTLAIGIGANTAVFSIVNRVLLTPLPYPDADRLVAVWHKAPGAPGLVNVSGDLRPSASMFFTYAEENRTFQAIGLWTSGSVTVTGLAAPEQVSAVFVSAGTLQALEVKPLLGRWLAREDQTPGGADTVMLGYGYWQRHFGWDSSVIGRGITVDSRVRTIVGVMPEGFRIVDADADLIVPFRFDRNRLILAGFGFQGIARLRPGVTIAEANADVARMVPIWMSAWPTIPGADPRVYETWRIAPALRPLEQDVVGNIGSALWVLMGTIGIVMLMVCANVANLVLVRAEARQQELAVRAALGAGWTRIARELLVESLLLGLTGGALGLALARAGLRLLVAMGPANLPRLREIAIDPRALAFTFAISLLAGILFGLIPAVKYARPGGSVALGNSARTSSQSRERLRVRNTLVVAQIALALVLLVSAGLMIRTSLALRAVEPGFARPEQLQTLRISIPALLVPDQQRVVRMQNDMLDKFAAIPGVTAAAFSNAMPMEGIAPDWDAIAVEGRTLPGEIPPLRLLKYVSPGFFRTAGTRILAGRDYTWSDLYALRPAAIVSENLARELWGSPAAALGKRIGAGLPGMTWREVIGVVQDVRDNGVHEPAPSIVYWPAMMDNLYRPGQAGQVTVSRSVTFAIRSERAGTEGLVDEVRQAVASVNGSVSLAAVRTMQEIEGQSMTRTSFTLVMLMIAGAMALVLGIVGIYGVISYSVSRRTREIGIRLALGAQGSEMKRMVVGRGLMLAGAGVAIGLGAATGLTRLMSSLLFGISPLDPATFVSVPVLLAIASALASYLPARRAAAVNLVDALKVE